MGVLPSRTGVVFLDLVLMMREPLSVTSAKLYMCQPGSALLGDLWSWFDYVNAAAELVGALAPDVVG